MSEETTREWKKAKETSGSCIAALDVGTTSVKVCLFSPDLTLLSCSVQEYSLTKEGSRVEASAETYQTAIRDGFKEVLSQVPLLTPAALSVTTQGETLSLFDIQGNPLRPFLVWLDSRAEEAAAFLRKELPEETFYRETGLPEITGALPLAKLLWLKENEPESFSRAHKVLLLEDWLLFWLTGRFVSEKSLQTSTGWFSLKEDGWWTKALCAAGINEKLLPELLECGTTVGGLLPETAVFLGLPEGIPVVTGAMDQTAAALALSCALPGTITETTGTALVVAACTDRPRFPEGHHVTIYRHALSGRYLYLPLANTAGMALRWFRDEFCRDLPGGAAGYQALDALAQTVPCGCDGLTFLPFLAGSVDPDTCPNARAVFYGARLSTSRAHFVRSVMESVAFLLRDFFAMLESLDCPAEKVFSLGGGTRSQVWQQIKADVCGRAFHVPTCSEAAAMGAALLAGWGSGLIPSGTFPVCRESAVYLPNNANRQPYDKAYRQYQELYAAVRPLYDKNSLPSS